jgi:hypothetical protein
MLNRESQDWNTFHQMARVLVWSYPDFCLISARERGQ